MPTWRVRSTARRFYPQLTPEALRAVFSYASEVRDEALHLMRQGAA